MTVELVQTERLTLERLRPDHAPEMTRLLLDPRIVPTIWPSSHPPTETAVLDGLAQKVDHWERHGFGLWLARDRRTGAMVGRGGLQYTYLVELGEVEAAWTIVPDRWGQGLATELARAAIDVAFGHLELTAIVALTLPDNFASRRVMEKTGFAFEREIRHAGLPHVLYRLPADRPR